MRFAAEGHGDLLEALRTALLAASWPAPPRGFEPLAAPRPMRAVFHGTVTGPGGAAEVVLKWHRATSPLGRLRRGLQGGRGPREARALLALRAAGVRAPEPLCACDEGADFLLARRWEGARALPPADEASREDLVAVAALLAAAHAAGLRHRDVHPGNLALSPRGAVLLDLGGARVAGPLSERERVTALARARHGLLGGARRTQRLRALRAWLLAEGRPAPSGEGLRALVAHVEERAARVARAYRTGRDRRARRDGEHFEQIALSGGVRGARFRDATHAALAELAARWLSGDPPGATPLKAGGAVWLVPASLPTHGRLVLKRYRAAARGRTPRGVAAFRRAHALANRHLPAPTALLCVGSSGGGSLLLSEYVDAPDLDRLLRSGGYDRLPRARRLALLRALGRTLRALHDAEVSHRDLKAPNLLVDLRGAAPRVLFADLEGARVRSAPIGWPLRERNLARLEASVAAPATDRLRVLRAYCAVPPWPTDGLAAIARRIRAHAQRKLVLRLGSSNPRFELPAQD
jgi:tRNA A-37 threonylcarbamoyl transferase component Bud32